ncbi:MAG: hypothetical protein AAF417_20960 [Pseudomonadota bacterium]
MNKTAYALSAIALLGAGSLLLFVRSSNESALPIDTVAVSGSETIHLSESARAIHDDVSARVAARNQQQPPHRVLPLAPSLSDRPNPPGWLRHVIEQGYINARYADLFLRDDYLGAVQEQFHVLKQAPLAPEEEACDRHDIEHARSVCWNRWGYEPYFTYEIATLQSMAESDAVAAATLAIRLEDEDARLYYAIRSTRLSGKPGPLVRYLTMHASTPDPQTANDALLRRYALALIVDDMGYPYRYSVGLAQDLERADVSSDDVNRSLVAGFTLQIPGRIGQ